MASPRRTTPFIIIASRVTLGSTLQYKSWQVGARAPWIAGTPITQVDLRPTSVLPITSRLPKSSTKSVRFSTRPGLPPPPSHGFRQ